MQLSFNPEYIRSQIALRRGATDMKLPMHERVKIHFMTRRGDLLSNFSLTAGAWMMLLNGFNAEGSDKAELDALKADVLEFKEWAEEGLQSLQRMGLQEAISDNEDAMPDDPILVSAMRKMLGIPHPADLRDRTQPPAR